MKRILLMCILCTATLAGLCPERKALFIEKCYPIVHISYIRIGSLLKKHKIWYSDIAKAQIKLETGRLKSKICIENRNLFGMRYAPQRKTTATGQRYNHAIYSTFEKSIEDYKLWQALYYKGGDYYTFLCRMGYAQDRNYIKKLRAIK